MGELGRFYAKTLVAAERDDGLAYDMLFGPAYKGIPLGAADLLVARSVDNLGILYSDQARLEDAAQQFRRALMIREKGLPPRHPELAVGLTNLGIVRRAQARCTTQGEYSNRWP